MIKIIIIIIIIISIIIIINIIIIMVMLMLMNSPRARFTPSPRIPYLISWSHYFSHQPKRCRKLSEPGVLDDSGKKLILEWWSVDWSIGNTGNVTGLKSLLIDWLIDWAGCGPHSWWVDWLIDWAGCGPHSWWVDWLIVGWLIDWLIDWYFATYWTFGEKLY